MVAGGGKESGIQHMSNNADQGAPVGAEERGQGNRVQNEMKERHSRLRSADGEWGVLGVLP